VTIKPARLVRFPLSLILSLVLLFNVNSLVFAQTYYLLTNHQGSAAAITNESDEMFSEGNVLFVDFQRAQDAFQSMGGISPETGEEIFGGWYMFLGPTANDVDEI
jgi:hypothetical protein